MDVTADQVRAFRLAKQGLVDPTDDPAAALAAWTVQDSPPGAATHALLARALDLPAGWLDGACVDRSVVSLYNARTATAIVPADQVAAYATAQLPEDEADLKFAVRNGVPAQDAEFSPSVDLAVDAISEALDGRSLSRDDLHEELRRRLPKALLPWCEGCQSHHAKRWLLVIASLRGRLCISGRVGRQPEFSRTDQWVTWEAPAAASAQLALLERYLGVYGPSKPGDFTDWAGISKPQGKRIWEAAADELIDVSVDGAAAGAILKTDESTLADPPALSGVRLLGPGDPLLLGRDRELLVPDAAVRKRLWTAIPTTGLILAGGHGIALWKAKKSGKRLDVTIDRFAKGGTKQAVEEAAERLGPHRGVSSVAVSWA